MEELTYEDLEKNGISTANIAVCKRLRRLAKLDRVKIDQNEHRSGLNKHLFDYIRYCGLDVLQFVSYCNDYIRDLYTSDLDLNFDEIEVFSMLQQISFTSYGKDTFSSISLLIDSLCVQKDSISKSAADFALVTFVSNLKLTEEQRSELMELLEQKFRFTSIKGIDMILSRIEEHMSIDSNSDGMSEENSVRIRTCKG